MLLLIILFSHTAFLWDNDAGQQFYSPTGYPIGIEEFMLEALLDNEVQTTVDTILPILDTLLTYDMLWITCGWRNDTMIKQQERDMISDYINQKKKVYLEGNMVVRILEPIDPNFIHQFGVKWNGFDYFIHPEVQGVEGTFLEGEIFPCDTASMLDEMVDRVDTVGTTSEVIFGTPTGKALISRGIGGSDFMRKDSDSAYATVFGTVNIAGFKSDTILFSDRERRMEYVQKILGFFGFGKVLVVDDNQSGNDRIEEDLDSLGVDYDRYIYFSQPPHPDTLKKYNVVLWTTGYTRDNTVEPQDQGIIQQYLEWGGRFLLAGEGIGSDIGIPGALDEIQFLSHWFGTDYIIDSMYPDTVEGIGSFYGIISKLSSNLADGLDTMDSGETILIYSGRQNSAGIKKQAANRKTEFLGFAYEGMWNRNARLGFLSRTLTEFNFNYGTTGIEEDEITESSVIIPYPNPFTSWTIIPTRSGSFEVYSITGRLLKRVEGSKWFGCDESGKKLPSGIYFFKSKSGERGKVILVR